MERIHSFLEGQEDLRIVEHLDMHKLPESLQQMRTIPHPQTGRSGFKVKSRQL